jgi:hypothetical protein
VTWESRDVTSSFEEAPAVMDTTFLENSKLLTATPHWIRKGDHTAMIGSPMDRAHVDPLSGAILAGLWMLTSFLHGVSDSIRPASCAG